MIAFTQNSLTDIDRLLQELQYSIDDFRALLDEAKSTAEETKAYNEGKIEVNGQEYQINEEFRHVSNAISTAIKISEEHAARLYIETQTDSVDDETAIIADVVRKYHDRRDFLLQDLRLLLTHSLSLDPDFESNVQKELQKIAKFVMGITEDMPISTGSKFTKKCLQSMDAIEKRQIELNDAIQSKQFLNQARGEAFYRTLEFQRSSLFKQHEALGAIITLLFRGSYTDTENIKDLHAKSLQWQKLDLACIHYLPAFSAAFHQYGSVDKSILNDAQRLNGTFISKSPDAPNAPYRPLAATLEMWWTAQYSSHFSDNTAPNSDADRRAKVVAKSLEDGSLEFMLSICLNISHNQYQHLARFELVQMLLEGSNISFEGSEQTSPFFVTLMMEAYEEFAESWITNMPDSIRKLKSEEDERRLQQITAGMDGTLQRPPREEGPRLHLEAFLVLIAFAFHDRSEAAEQFWEDPESNLYGFIQWASRRQTVPRVGAFCEMLSAISCSKENAENAHKFLLDEGPPLLNVRGRKLPSMTYQQIFAELDFYARRVHEKQQQSQTARSRANPEPELNEVESPVMLCCYLRLLGHLCRYTALARQFVFDNKDPDLMQSLLALSSGPIPSYLRAGVFQFFEALSLGDNQFGGDQIVLDKIWYLIDDWASTNHDRAAVVPADKQQPASLPALQNTLAAIGSSYDQYDAFLKLLLALVKPSPVSTIELPFPDDLGVSYRLPSIVPYVDLVCSQLRTSNVRTWIEDGNLQGMQRLLSSVVFMKACLEGFNEDYAASDKSASTLGNADSFSSIYSQRHPFARVMQWIFSAELNKCLLDSLGTFAESLSTARPDDPRLDILHATTALLTYVVEMQPTYFDIVKPRIRLPEGYKVIQYSGIVAIEDSIVGRSKLLLNLCEFAASEHVALSLQSLAFLTKLSESPRFNNHLFDTTLKERRAQTMLEAVGKEGELKLANISAVLMDHLTIDGRELEAGESSDGYQLKSGLISYLNACLSTQSDSPNIAHLLLGFQRVGSRLVPGLEFDPGTSMFDALANLSANYPDGFENGFLGWLTRLKAESISVLRHLWSFPVSSDLTMIQLRRSAYLCQQMSGQFIVSQATEWDGEVLLSPDFYVSTSAETFTDFLSFRMHLYDYINRELQLVSKGNMKAIQEKYVSSLQGKSIGPDGRPVNHATALDLFDFAELEPVSPEILDLTSQDLKWFQVVEIYRHRKNQLFEVEAVRSYLDATSSVFVREAAAANRSLDQDSLASESRLILMLVQGQNRYVLIQAEKLSCLRKYVDMVISIVDCCPMDSATKTQFALHMLQVILPKLDTYLSDVSQEAVELTRLADTLLLALTNTQPTTSRAQTRIDITIAEKLFQLFRICAEGVPQSAADPDLRAVLYSICAQYLTRILSSSALDADANKKACANAMDTVRSAGQQLINVVSDDADDGLDVCRLNALNFLAQLVSLARSQNSNILVESFVRSNTIEVLLDPIKTVAEEFHTTEPSSKSISLMHLDCF